MIPGFIRTPGVPGLGGAEEQGGEGTCPGPIRSALRSQAGTLGKLLNFLGLSFFACKMEIVMVATSRDCRDGAGCKALGPGPGPQ